MLRGSCLVLCFVYGLAVAVPSVAAPPAFPWQEWKAAPGTPTPSGHALPVVWFDADLDGHPEPVYLSVSGTFRMEAGPAGPEIVALSVPFGFAEPVSVSRLAVPLDIDRDGRDELLLVGTKSLLLRVAAPDVLELLPIPLPEIPIGGFNDAAPGDLDRDGWPDVVLSLSIDAGERAIRGLAPSAVLMHRGWGRFDLLPLEPVRAGFANGHTTADMDGDGDVDVVESMDGSFIRGLSRLLDNVTPDGEEDPALEVDPNVWDVGTAGMGAAVEDLDGDGRLDLYNSSGGNDLLTLRQPDGSWKDETFSRGILHAATENGVRVQWSPSLVDVDADGHFDVVVRQQAVSLSAFTSFGWGAGNSPDLLYRGLPGGGFERTPVPTSPEYAGGGRELAPGDLDRDGLPDFARDGGGGAPWLWRNGFDATGRRPLTVRLAPTVSGRPATGAVATAGACGQTLRRHASGGGKMGGFAAPELWFSFPGCEEVATIEIRWPSGATSVHTSLPDDRLLVAEEPLWAWIDPAAPSHLHLDPTGTGHVEACAVMAPGETTCCAGPCDLVLTGPESAPALVRLDGERPIRFAPRASSWALSIEPAIPVPGKSVVVSAVHRGPPGSFPETPPGLLVAGAPVAWDDVFLDVRVLRAEVSVPVGPKSLPVSLSGGEAKASFPIGALFVPAWTVVDRYGTRPLDAAADPAGSPGWQVYLTPLASSDVTNWPLVSFETAGGEPLPVAVTADGTSGQRLRFVLPWSEVAGLDQVVATDGAFSVSLPVHEPPDLPSLLALVSGFEAGAQRPRLVHRGDATPFMWTPVDATGSYVPLPADAVSFHASEMELVVPATPIPGTIDHVAMLRSNGEPDTTTDVWLRLADDRLFGPWPIRLRGRTPRVHDFGKSTAEISDTSVEPGEVVEVSVYAVDEFGDALLADTDVAIEVSGGLVVEGPQLWVDMRSSTLVEAGSGEQDMTIEVFLAGDLFETFVVEVTPPEAPPEPEPSGADAEPDAAAGPEDAAGAAETAPDTSTDPAEPPRRRSGGCRSADDASPLSSIVSLLAAAFVFASRRRRAAAVLLLLMGGAAAASCSGASGGPGIPPGRGPGPGDGDGGGSEPEPGPRGDVTDCFGLTAGSPCEDGDPCTFDGKCAGGVCHPGGFTTCEEGGPCEKGSCTTFVGCEYAPRPDGSPCDADGDACTLDACDGAGSCHGSGSTLACEGTDCVPASCDPAKGCVTGPFLAGTTCDDGEPCTAGDLCQDETTGCAGTPLPTDDANDCTADSCEGGVVSNAPLSGTSCLAEDPETPGQLVAGKCESGACLPLPPGSCVTDLDCPAEPGACLSWKCEPGSGTCLAAVVSGVFCDDGDACTSLDTCELGSCLGTGVSCDDDNECTIDGCEPETGCTHEPSDPIGGCEPACPAVVVDVSWGAGGTVLLDAPLSDYDTTGDAAARHPDGSVWVAGHHHVEGQGPNAHVARLEANGTLDASFGNQGFVDDLALPPASFSAVVPLPDGRVLLGGERLGKLALVRVEADGEPDFTFGSGSAVLFTGLDVHPKSRDHVVADAEGNVYAAGSALNDMRVVKLTPEGDVDTSWGQGGTAIASIGDANVAYTLVLDAEGRVLVAGAADDAFGSARFDEGGSLDPAWNKADPHATDVSGLQFHDEARGGVFLPDGSLVLVGCAACGDGAGIESYPALVKYGPSGVLDPSFGDGGIAVSPVPPQLAGAGGGVDSGLRAVLPLPDGRLLAAGWSRSDTVEGRMLVVRYLPTGEVDECFAQGGFHVQEGFGAVPSQADRAQDLLLHEDLGTVLVVGTVDPTALGHAGLFALLPP